MDRKVEPEAGAVHGAIPKRDQNKETKKGSPSKQGETANPDDGTAKEDETLNIGILMADSNIEQFSIKRPDDEECAEVGGILVLSQNIIIADCENKKLKLFDLSGKYMSSVHSIHFVWGITAVTGNRFATCGMNTVVRLWTLHGKTIVTEDISYDVDHYSHGIHYNGTYFCVLHNGSGRSSGRRRLGRRYSLGWTFIWTMRQTIYMCLVG